MQRWRGGIHARTHSVGARPDAGPLRATTPTRSAVHPSLSRFRHSVGVSPVRARKIDTSVRSDQPARRATLAIFCSLDWSNVFASVKRASVCSSWNEVPCVCRRRWRERGESPERPRGVFHARLRVCREQRAHADEFRRDMTKARDDGFDFFAKRLARVSRETPERFRWLAVDTQGVHVAEGRDDSHEEEAHGISSNDIGLHAHTTLQLGTMVKEPRKEDRHRGRVGDLDPACVSEQIERATELRVLLQQSKNVARLGLVGATPDMPTRQTRRRAPHDTRPGVRVLTNRRAFEFAGAGFAKHGRLAEHTRETVERRQEGLDNASSLVDVPRKSSRAVSISFAAGREQRNDERHERRFGRPVAAADIAARAPSSRRSTRHLPNGTTIRPSPSRSFRSIRPPGSAASSK